MVKLIDINVLLALTWPNHLHHAASRHWFKNACPQGWATCPFTESGFIRLSSNPKVFADAVSPRQALKILQSLKNRGSYEFWPSSISLTDWPQEMMQRLTGYRQVTDLYLICLALSKKGSLVTFDRKLQELLPTGKADGLVEVIPNGLI